MRFEVLITRMSYASLNFGVEASSKEEAEKKALELARNTSWDEDGADYNVDEITESDRDDEDWNRIFGDNDDDC